MDSARCRWTRSRSSRAKGSRTTEFSRSPGPAADIVPERGVVDHCTLRGYWQLGLREIHGRWLITHWAVRRTCPWEGSPDVCTLAAARATTRL
jgi:hypothetical protein